MTKPKFTSRVRLMLRKLGWDVRRYSPLNYPDYQVNQALSHVDADLIFDIGANTGGFAESLREAGFNGDIISFEPLTDAHEQLAHSAQDDPRWIVHPRCAIGDSNGEIQFNIARNSLSSSVLPMLECHSHADETSAYIGSEVVPIARLDDLAEAYLNGKPNARYFIKIDTQGYEWSVLDGAPETLKSATGLICELSLVPLYSGQRLWRDVIDRLEGKGFQLWSMIEGFTNQEIGRSLQFDGIFLRADVDDR